MKWSCGVKWATRKKGGGGEVEREGKGKKKKYLCTEHTRENMPKSRHGPVYSVPVTMEEANPACRGCVACMAGLAKIEHRVK